MINGNTSSESGGQQPEREELEPDSLETIARLLDELGDDGAELVLNIKLAERDLRTIAAIEPKFAHAFERADHLADARVVLERILEEAAEAVKQPAATPARDIGKAAVGPLSRLVALGNSIRQKKGG